MSQIESEGLPEEERPQRARERKRGSGFSSSGLWIAVGVTIALLAGSAGVLLFSQTQWGRAEVLSLTLRTLGGRLNGRLQIQRLEGNLLTGASLYDLTLTDSAGVPLATAESAYVRYRLDGLVGGDIILNRLVVYDATINLLRVPGDTLWNYQRVLRDPTPAIPPGPPRAILIEGLELFGGRITVRAPFQPDSRLSEQRQQLALEEALADTARWMLESVPGGYLRTTLIDVESAVIPEVFVGPDERGGIYVDIADAIADVRLWRDPPLQIRGLQSQLHLRENIINFKAAEFALPGSRGEAVGRVNMTQGRPMYDVVLTMPVFDVSDLRWLYPWLPNGPEAGHGSARVWIEDRPQELMVLARDLVLDLPGTRVTGQAGFLTGDSPRFFDVDLEADSLDVDAVERLLPEELPVDGLEIGGVRIQGS